ncbi:MAG: hypothetical protein WCO56_25205 [Verrucomicrobiota bacterium]
MNKGDIQIVISSLAQIEQNNVGERIATQYKNKELTTIYWQDISAAEFPGLVARAVVQLRAAMESKDARFYPNIFPCEVGSYQNRNVVNIIQQFLNQIKANDWANSITLLMILIDYQIFCGFWDKSERKLHGADEIRGQELITEIETRKLQVSALSDEVKQALSGLQDALGSIRGTRDEVSQILGKVRKDSEEVANTANQAAGRDGKLMEIVKTQENHKIATEKQLMEINSRNEELKNNQNQVKEQLDKSEKAYLWIKEKEAVVNELAGTAAAGILGQKFEERKNALKPSVDMWMKGVVLAFIASSIWITVSFSYLRKDGGDIWHTLIMNFGLLLPAVFATGWTIRQYARERQYQEEYAFRSSVAMTLSAFADRLQGVQDSRAELIRTTVERLYQMPIDLTIKPRSSFFGRTKPLEELTKVIVEAIKETRGKS